MSGRRGIIIFSLFVLPAACGAAAGALAALAALAWRHRS